MKLLGFIALSAKETTEEVSVAPSWLGVVVTSGFDVLLVVEMEMVGSSEVSSDARLESVTLRLEEEVACPN